MKPRILALVAAAALALPALAAHVATVIGVTNAPASAVTLATNSAYRVRVWPLRLDAFNWTMAADTITVKRIASSPLRTNTWASFTTSSGQGSQLIATNYFSLAPGDVLQISATSGGTGVVEVTAQTTD